MQSASTIEFCRKMRSSILILIDARWDYFLDEPTYTQPKQHAMHARTLRTAGKDVGGGEEAIANKSNGSPSSSYAKL